MRPGKPGLPSPAEETCAHRHSRCHFSQRDELTTTSSCWGSRGAGPHRSARQAGLAENHVGLNGECCQSSTDRAGAGGGAGPDRE